MLGLPSAGRRHVCGCGGRAALTLRPLGGLTTDEIARAFLVPEPTVAQRIVRAKKTLANAQVPFEVPQGDELAARLASELEVVYLIFNEGYSATAGDEWMRPALCEDALQLGRILARLAPREPEVHGLVALMEIQASRALQAAIAACHARARRVEDTDWERIAWLYEHLAEAMPSPVVELNRAVALSMAFGPETGLALLDQLMASRPCRTTTRCPACAATSLAKLGTPRRGWSSSGRRR
jgi:predicted RNA polymerase sigma factor